jgi:putative FmdB family regulatory protein
MPIYEYECNACGDRHEFIQKFSEGPKRKCPSCGEQRLRKLISAAAFHLKGSGWYVTDFRDRDKKKANGKAEKEQTKAEASSETKADTKPAKKEPKKKGGGAADTA